MRDSLAEGAVSADFAFDLIAIRLDVPLFFAAGEEAEAEANAPVLCR